MKYSLLLFYLLFCFRPDAAAQELPATALISLKLENKPLKQVLEALEQQADVHFSYSKKRIPVHQKISLQVENMPLEQVLAQLLTPLQIKWERIEAQWVLTPATNTLPQTSAPSAPAEQYTLSGYVRDRETGEALIGALVMTEHPRAGAVTNAYGFYSLSLPAGNYQLRSTYLGYSAASFSLQLNASKTENFLLQPIAEQLAVVEVDAEESLSLIDKSLLLRTDLSQEQVAEMPALFGEEEVLKSLQLLPGIGANNDGSALFHVRGGASDQNLILLDDAPIYNPAHTLGLFTTIVPEAVKDIKIYKGDMPATYGGRLSSVIDVRTRDGNSQRFGFSGSLGMATLQLSAEGPLARKRASYFVSLRNAHLKGYFQSFNPDISDYGFHDLNIKLNYGASQRNRYYLSFYSGGDRYEEGASSGLRWGNSALSLRWNHVFNPRLFANTTLYTSRYDFFLIPSLQQKSLSWHSGIANLSLKSDFSYFPNPRHQLDFGLEVRGHDFMPGNVERDGQLLPDSTRIISKRFARESVLYVSHEYRPLEKLRLSGGMRLNLWRNVGESFEYTFDAAHKPVDSVYHKPGQPYHTYARLEPRLGLYFSPDSATTLSLHYARTVQNIHRISNSISPFTNLEVWLPSGPNIQPQTADLVSLAFFRQWQPRGIHFSAELYYKKMRHQTGYKPHAQLLLNPYLEGELRFGSARAWGLELMLQKKAPRFSSSAAYTFSRVQLQFEALNGGLIFPAAHDRPHQFELYGSFRPTKRWLFSGNWQWASGKPFTAPIAYYHYEGSTVPLYGALHNDRLPSYHRLDLAAELNLSRRGGRHEHRLKLSVYNLYGRKNPIYLNFNKVLVEGGKLVVPSDKQQNPEKTASQTYLFRFVPALSYHFRL